MMIKTETITREETIRRIKKALLGRSGKSWSVRGGRGTAWGWITIISPPNRQNEFGYISEADKNELKKLLSLNNIGDQGIDIPASSQYRQEYVDRAEGRKPSVIGGQH